MITELVELCASGLNVFPAIGGISSYYRPEALMIGKVIDYNKHCKFEFGEYVLAHTETNPTKKMKECTIEGIYLQASTNLKGGHVIMNLSTGKKITRPQLTAVPLTETVKQKVEQMVQDQNITTVKFNNLTGVNFPKSDWIAGVNYKELLDHQELEVLNAHGALENEEVFENQEI